MGTSETYVAVIECSDKMRAKLGSLHHLDLQDVRDAVQWPAKPLRASWIGVVPEDDRGPRLVMEGRTSTGRVIRAVLYPVDSEGTWRLGTAFPLPGS